MTELHITAGVKTAGDDEETKRFIAQQVARVLALHGDEPWAKVSPEPAPVYVLVSYDQHTMTGDTQGAFTTLAAAREEAWLAHENYRQDPNTRGMYATIETWEGGTFVEQRRLISKLTRNGELETVWEFSAAPTFNPIIETIKEDNK